ncbi:MAG TPA: hypothetical protein VIV60_09260 [Polyangiaceae bacterium]
MQRWMLLVCACGFFAGCTSTHSGYLVRIDNGQRSSVTFHENPNGNRGSIEANLESGQPCQGQYNTIPDQVTRNWEDTQEILSEDSQLGVAVVRCSDNRVLRCNFSRTDGGSGSGHCADNQGQQYALSF